MIRDCAKCGIVIDPKTKKEIYSRYAMLELYRNCRGYADFTTGDVQYRYCPHQISWVIQHSELLHEGRKPMAESGYTDAPSKGRKSDATRTQDVIMEVERRLEHCRLDGLMVILYHKDGYDERFLGRYYRESEAAIRRRIEATILHISGRTYKERFRYDRYRALRDYFRWEKRG